MKKEVCPMQEMREGEVLSLAPLPMKGRGGEGEKLGKEEAS